MFKKAKVVMLPTNQKAHFGDIILTPTSPKTLLIFQHQNCTEVAQSLYITSDEEIKQSDWYINLNTNKIDICNYHDESISINKFANNYCIKIIATTDTSLGWSNIGRDESGTAIGNCHKGNGMIIKSLLPQPSQQFIEKYIEEYNKSNVITDILVEYEIETNALFKVYESDPIKLKVNPKDNTITIKKVKDNWNREEVFKLCRDSHYAGSIGIDRDIWIEENL